MQIHHLIPVENGGRSEYDNLIALCSSCHSKIHTSNVDRSKLRQAKRHWVNHNKDLLTKLISTDSNDGAKRRLFIEAFDAVQRVESFDAFRSRLTGLLDRGDVFNNFFRVRHHKIRHEVDQEGNARVYETQRFSPFSPMGRRKYHIWGYGNPSEDAVAFRAEANIRKRNVPITVRLTHQEPKHMAYEISFAAPVTPTLTAEVSFTHAWPGGWKLPKDQYTYDVLAWVENVEYEMKFSPETRVIAVSSSFVDMFGRSWPDIGMFTSTPTGFRWKATRLPMFTVAILPYETALSN